MIFPSSVHGFSSIAHARKATSSLLNMIYKIYVQMQTRMYKFEACHARVSLLTKFSINSAVMALEEQRAYIKISTLLGATPTDIKAMLMKVKLRHISQLQDGSCDLSRVGSPLKMTPFRTSLVSVQWRWRQTSARLGRSLYNGWDFWVIERRRCVWFWSKD